MNLERYSDFESRLPRGRSYVRNGSVVDLQIAKGEVAAMVAGSELYKIKITIAPVKPHALEGHLPGLRRDRSIRWSNCCRAGWPRASWTGSAARATGCFRRRTEIKLSCSCPDWADMCKHVAAALYGVGARLDKKPELLFVLRGVDENELLAGAGGGLIDGTGGAQGRQAAQDRDVGALFGLEMSEPGDADVQDAKEAVRKPRKATSGPRGKKAAAAKLPQSPKISAAKSASGQHADKKAAGSHKAATNAGKRRAQPRLQPSA